MFCPNCGKEVGTEGGFCPNCGTKIEGGSSPSLAIRGSIKQNLSLIGGALLLVSFFMPWVNFGPLSLAGFNLIKAATGTEKLLALLGWLIPIGGGITAYFAYTKNPNVKGAALISGAIAAIVWIWLFFAVKKEVSASLGKMFGIIGIGLYVMLAGVICLGIFLKSTYTELKA